MTSTTTERLWWTLAGLYVASIYVGAYFLQFFLDGLRERGWLETTLRVGFLGVGALVLAAIARIRPRKREWLVVPVALTIYAWLWNLLEVIQERVHLIQYGLLAALFFAAFEARQLRTRRGRPLLYSLVCTALVGWGDEGVQAVLPNRTYDLRDVGLNALSGGLFLGLLALHRYLRSAPLERTY